MYQSEDLQEDEQSQCMAYTQHYTYRDCVLGKIEEVSIRKVSWSMMRLFRITIHYWAALLLGSLAITARCARGFYLMRRSALLMSLSTIISIRVSLLDA